MRLTLAILVVAVTVGVHALPTRSSSPLAISASKLMVRSPVDTSLSTSNKEKTSSKFDAEKSSSLDFKQTGSNIEPATSKVLDNQDKFSPDGTLPGTSGSALDSQKLDGSSVSQIAGQDKVASTFDQNGKLDDKMGNQFGQTSDLAREGVDKIRNQVGKGVNPDVVAQVGDGQVRAEVGKTVDEASKTIAQVGQGGQFKKDGNTFGIGRQVAGTTSSDLENKKFQSNTQSQSAMQSGSSRNDISLAKTGAFFQNKNIAAFQSQSSSSFQYKSVQTISQDFKGFSNGFGDFRKSLETSAWSQTQTVEYYRETCSNFNFLSQRFASFDFSQGVDASFSQGFVMTLYEYLQMTQQILTLLIERYGTLAMFSSVFADNYVAVQRCMGLAIRFHIDLSWIFSRLDMRVFAQAGLSFDRFQRADANILIQGGYKYSLSQSASSSSSMASGSVLR